MSETSEIVLLEDHSEVVLRRVWNADHHLRIRVVVRFSFSFPNALDTQLLELASR